MAALVYKFARSDERQFLFIVFDGEMYSIIETAELWEEPKDNEAGVCFFCYPTVFSKEEFKSEDEALAVVANRYGWPEV